MIWEAKKEVYAFKKQLLNGNTRNRLKGWEYYVYSAYWVKWKLKLDITQVIIFVSFSKQLLKAFIFKSPNHSGLVLVGFISTLN